MVKVVEVLKVEDVPDKLIDGKPTLVYWDLVGLVQPLRLALVYKGVDFVDVRIQAGAPSSPDCGAAWGGAKKKLYGIMPFPNLPYFMDDCGVNIAQTNTILHHIARKYELMGVEGQEHMTDYYCDHLTDLECQIIKFSYGAGAPAVFDWYKTSGPGALKSFSSILKDKRFLTGDVPTVADFKLYVFLYKLTVIQVDLGNPETAGILTEDLKAYMGRIEELPNVKEYIASAEYQKRPINNTMAGWIGD
jgi:glutathione S-transferase